MASGDKLAFVTNAVVGLLVRPLSAGSAHRAAAAVVEVLDALHTHIVSNAFSRVMTKSGDLRKVSRRNRSSQANVKPIWSGGA